MVVSHIFGNFHPDALGFMVQFDGAQIFQMGWFNHHLVQDFHVDLIKN